VTSLVLPIISSIFLRLGLSRGGCLNNEEVTREPFFYLLVVVPKTYLKGNSMQEPLRKEHEGYRKYRGKKMNVERSCVNNGRARRAKVYHNRFSSKQPFVGQEET